MIPSTWSAYHRDDDGELLGYLVSEGLLHAPVTVFGYRLADAADEYDAGQVLEGIGLSYLADTWLLSLEGREGSISVQIVEASPERLRVKSVDYGYEDDYGTIFELPVPEPGRLRRQTQIVPIADPLSGRAGMGEHAKPSCEKTAILN